MSNRLKLFKNSKGFTPLFFRSRTASNRVVRESENQRGDTIVEVLISISILSLILTISYALSNRNTAYIRQSQERGEAQKISERQLELLRGYLTSETPWQSSFRCFNDAGQPTADGCGNINGLYNIQISVDPDDAKTYTVTTTWSSLTGNTAPQNLQLSYKLPVVGAFTGGPPTPACSDGGDNDGDGLIDLSDPNCDNALDGDESSPTSVLTVAKNPNGGGTVTGNGINCGSDCTTELLNGGSITLTATPAANYVFTHWSEPQCASGTVAITIDATCTANFTYAPRTPLHRCYQNYVAGHSHGVRYLTDHFYSTAYNVNGGICYPEINSYYWWIQYEGVAGYVPIGGPYTLLPVYGGGEMSWWYDSFYTTYYPEYISAHNGGWWNSSGIQGWYLFGDCSVAGTVPFYRFWHDGIGDHLYTTNWAEGANAGYSYEGVQGCLFQNP